MTTALTVLIVLALVSIGFAAGWVLRQRGVDRVLDKALRKAAAEEPDPEVAIRAAIEGLLSATRGASTMRFEISVDDWGPYAPNPEMRWRWTIWDADRLTLAALEPTAPASIGVEIPAMLGNAPTKMKALDDALHWVLEEGGTVVVVPSLIAVEAES